MTALVQVLRNGSLIASHRTLKVTLSPPTRRFWVIDGSKALRKAIDQVFGPQPVQRCRNHKLRNVLGHLPKEDHDQVKAVIRAAWKLEAKEGMVSRSQLKVGGPGFL